MRRNVGVQVEPFGAEVLLECGGDGAEKGLAQLHRSYERRPTAPGSRRPPQVVRERRPALAALALLLIVGGALGAAYLVLQNGHRVAAIEVTQSLEFGWVIVVFWTWFIR